MKNNDMQRAKELFESGNYTCVLCKGDEIITSTERGVKPLFTWLEGKGSVKGIELPKEAWKAVRQKAIKMRI